MLKSHYKHDKLQEFSIAVKSNVTTIRNTSTAIHKINFINRTEITFNITQLIKRMQSKLSCYLIRIRFVFVVTFKTIHITITLSAHNIQSNCYRENVLLCGYWQYKEITFDYKLTVFNSHMHFTYCSISYKSAVELHWRKYQIARRSNVW